MRPLFTDRWNSFWHVFFGAVAVHFHMIIPLFIIYQLLDWRDRNLICDLSEFFIGYGICYMLTIFYFKSVKYRK
jgi:hypothetical protein